MNVASINMHAFANVLHILVVTQGVDHAHQGGGDGEGSSLKALKLPESGDKRETGKDG